MSRRSIPDVEVTVKLFAVLRERAGASEVTLELPEGARVRDAIESLASVTAGVPVVMAVNREYADADVVLSEADELALVPPVSGGETVLVHARVTSDPLSVDALAGLVRNPAAGAVVVFEGVTREVEALEYEAYVEMAEEKITAILESVKEEHGLLAVAAEHRVGLVPLSQPSVIVAASAPHRGEAFAGARAAIDRIKAEAPIWKKEIEGGAGGWVEGTLP